MVVKPMKNSRGQEEKESASFIEMGEQSLRARGGCLPAECNSAIDRFLQSSNKYHRLKIEFRAMWNNELYS